LRDAAPVGGALGAPAPPSARIMSRASASSAAAHAQSVGSGHDAAGDAPTCFAAHRATSAKRMTAPQRATRTSEALVVGRGGAARMKSASRVARVRVAAPREFSRARSCL